MLSQIKNPINAVNPSSLVKSSYGFVPTDSILETFKAQGWAIASTQVAKTKVEARQGYQRHIIRLEHPDFKSINGLSESNTSRPQLCLVNSHDGSSSLRLFYGLIRIACLNGIIAGNVFRSFRAVHNEHIVAKLNNGIEYMVNGLPEFTSQIENLARLKFSESALDELLHTLVDMRLQNVNGIVSVDYDSALKVRRAADTSNDAYTVYNRIQESLMRGGIKYTYTRDIKSQDGTIIDSKVIQTTTKRLTSIDSQIKLNQEAFNLAVKLAA